MRGCLLSSFYFPKKRNSLNFRLLCVLNIGEVTLFQRKILLTLFYPIPELLVLDYSLSVPYLDTKMYTFRYLYQTFLKSVFTIQHPVLNLLQFLFLGVQGKSQIFPHRLKERKGGRLRSKQFVFKKINSSQLAYLFLCYILLEILIFALSFLNCDCA